MKMMWFDQVRFLPNKTCKNLVKSFLLDFYVSSQRYRLAWSVFLCKKHTVKPPNREHLKVCEKLSAIRCALLGVFVEIFNF